MAEIAIGVTGCGGRMGRMLLAEIHGTDGVQGRGRHRIPPATPCSAATSASWRGLARSASWPGDDPQKLFAASDVVVDFTAPAATVRSCGRGRVRCQETPGDRHHRSGARPPQRRRIAAARGAHSDRAGAQYEPPRRQPAAGAGAPGGRAAGRRVRHRDRRDASSPPRSMRPPGHGAGLGARGGHRRAAASISRTRASGCATAMPARAGAGDGPAFAALSAAATWPAITWSIFAGDRRADRAYPPRRRAEADFRARRQSRGALGGGAAAGALRDEGRAGARVMGLASTVLAGVPPSRGAMVGADRDAAGRAGAARGDPQLGGPPDRGGRAFRRGAAALSRADRRGTAFSRVSSDHRGAGTGPISGRLGALLAREAERGTLALADPALAAEQFVALIVGAPRRRAGSAWGRA